MQRVCRSSKIIKNDSKIVFYVHCLWCLQPRRGVSWDDCVTGMLAYHGMQTAEDTKPFGLQTAKGFIRVYFLNKRKKSERSINL